MGEDVIEDPVLRQRYVFRRATRADGDEVLEVELWVDPGGGVVPHLHPGFEEVFAVLSGEVTFRIGGKKVVARAGERAVVAPGTRHTYRNTGDEIAHVLCEARPPHPDLQHFLEDAAAIARAGGYTRHALPRTVRGMLQLAIMARRYRATTLVLTVPPFLQAPLFEPLARLGERRGLRVRTFAGP